MSNLQEHHTASKKLIVIGGPTAAGKTGVAIQLAQAFQTEILSADSRQIFRELNIGTAKPTDNELNCVPHHFINTCSIADSFTAFDFEREALAVLDKLFQSHEFVICVGGTGLYLKALLHGFDPVPDVSSETVAQLEQQLKQHGTEVIFKQLIEHDPVYAERVDKNNPHRIIRALSVCLETGKPFSSFLSGSPKPRFFKSLCINLTWPRELLYERINSRVDEMVEKGLELEARQFLDFRDLQALQTVGYSEFFEFFDGHIDREEAIRRIKRNSRRYAKRQMTWFRNQGEWRMMDAQDPNLIDQIKQLANKY